MGVSQAPSVLSLNVDFHGMIRWIFSRSKAGVVRQVSLGPELRVKVKEYFSSGEGGPYLLYKIIAYYVKHRS